MSFEQADLLENQSQWYRKFNFVLEIFTVQALPPKYEMELIHNIADFVTPGGQLLVIAEVATEERTFENGPPWLLTPEHVNSFVSCGFEIQGKVVEKGSLTVGDNIFVTTFTRAST